MNLTKKQPVLKYDYIFIFVLNYHEVKKAINFHYVIHFVTCPIMFLHSSQPLGAGTQNSP